MSDKDKYSILQKLLEMPDDNEVVEFKSAKKDFDFSKLGQYFSALSNESNLKKVRHAWLVLGVEDKNHEIVGTDYKVDARSLHKLKHDIAQHINNRLTFMDIFEFRKDGKRIVMFHIPAALRGIPTSFMGHYYGRDGDALVALNISEIEEIMSQGKFIDWSAGIVKEASVDDLDPDAMLLARKNFKEKFRDKSDEVDSWNDITFLNKAKITKNGKVTNTAIILLGKEESVSYLNPATAIIRWVLKDSFGNDKDYQIFFPPLLKTVDQVYAKIRNLKYRYIKDGTLFPDEVDQYEPYSIREALNNCIAHQDYTLGGRINVIELEDELIFTNKGSFIPKSVEKVIDDNAPEEQYRNLFLANAMFNLKMVDTQGGGIRKMFHFQRIRYFPMPEYEFVDNRVKLTLTGKVISLDYSKILLKNDELTLHEIILLDKFQKKKKLTLDEENLLKSKKLIDGRKPNYFFSQSVAQTIGQKANYSKNKAFDKTYYLDLIRKSIKEHKSVSRHDIDELLWKKLSDWMNDKQRKNKISNLLSELRDSHEIKNIGTFKNSKWVLIDR